MSNVNFTDENIEKLLELGNSNFFTTFVLDDNNENELSDLISIVEIAFEETLDDFVDCYEYTITYYKTECVVEFDYRDYCLTYREIEELDIRLV